MNDFQASTTGAAQEAGRVRAWSVALREAAEQDHREVRYFAGSECRCGEVLPCPILAALNQNIAALDAVLARWEQLEGEREKLHRALDIQKARCTSAEKLLAVAVELCTAAAELTGRGVLRNLIAHWHETNTAIGEASGNGNPADPYLYAALLDSRAGWWLQLARARDADPNRPPHTTDVYAVACHYAAILDQADAARVRYAHSIPTLHPGTLVAHLDLERRRCTSCGRPWQLDPDGACQQCPRLLWGISPQSAHEISKYPPGEPWTPTDHDDHQEQDG